MKSVKILVSEESAAEDAMTAFDSAIAASQRGHPEVQLLRTQVRDCVEDFISRAIQVKRAGTTIRLERQLDAAGLSVLITLASPGRRNLFTRIIRQLFQRI